MTAVLWGALHGLGMVERAGRLRAQHRDECVAELACP
ncbi:hypothetical protein FHS23_001604 [Prauserella isguenensis]|uniref:TetR family transcriptional regulator n=1 Tax=Prauserella isguenensis TaxID=1470180 RepID=A0A839S1D8_9PSEU|nr:hypothetical protein [Prauserella isguenensis]